MTVQAAKVRYQLRFFLIFILLAQGFPHQLPVLFSRGKALGKTNDVNDKLAALRNMLWQMEVEVGLESLPQPQKDVYYAACLVADEERMVHSESIRRHPMLAPMARPTFYRAMKELVNKGFMATAGQRKDGRYLVKR